MDWLKMLRPIDGTTEVLANMKAWAAHPFQEDMPIFGWFLFIGLLLCLLVAWTLIMREIIE